MVYGHGWRRKGKTLDSRLILLNRDLFNTLYDFPLSVWLEKTQVNKNFQIAGRE